MSKRYSLSKEFACSLFGKTRQGYDKVQALCRKRLIREKSLCEAVDEVRSKDPGIGGYKLWRMMKDIFEEEMVRGRDSFFKFLDKYNYTLPAVKPRRTTNSNHRYHKYSNVAKDKKVTAPDQLWVSDITYIELEKDKCYLHLVTDAFSHKIVGWNLAGSLAAVFTKEALRDAIGNATRTNLEGLVHHSDRGVQYCCDEYVKELNDHKITISMTEDYKPTDNAIAERVNGIIKTELLYRIPRLSDIKEARKRIEDFINFYNNDRPHMSIDYQTPAKVYKKGGCYEKRWKKKLYIKKESLSLQQEKGQGQPIQEKEQPAQEKRQLNQEMTTKLGKDVNLFSKSR